jgi:hypothetical protein
MAVQHVEAERSAGTPDLIVETIRRAPAAPEAQESLGEALAVVVRGLGRRVERQVPSLIITALVTFFSRAVEDAVRRRADEAIHTAVMQAAEAVPDQAAGQEVLRQAEDVAQATTHDLLDSLFAGPIRADLEQYGRTAAEAMFGKDMETAQQTVKEALSATLRDALAVVKDHQSDISRAVVGALTKATAEAAASTVAEGAESAAAGPVQAVAEAISQKEPKGQSAQETQETEEKRSEPVKKRVEKQGENIRDQLEDIGQTLRRQVEEETKGLKDRLTGGVKDGAKQGMRNQQLGRAPSAGSSKRSSLGRPPSRGPAGRPPSARRKR